MSEHSAEKDAGTTGEIVGRKKTGGCKCRGNRGRLKRRYRSQEQATWAIERYELDAEPYKCPAPGDGWHIRTVKHVTPPGS